MRYLFLLVFLIITTVSCSQNSKNLNIAISEKNNHINSKNFVDELTKRVKHFDKEPRYFIRPTQTNCVFEILVNGMLSYKEYTLDKIASPIEINSEILKSGPQTITVRMYPIGDLIKETYGSGNAVTTLQRNSNVAIKVVKYEAFNISDELEDEIVVMLHESPTNKHTGNFTGDGLPFYEYTFTFNATVPYEMEGWSNGEDLTKFDKDELEQAVVKFYKNYQNIYKNKDEDALAKTVIGDIYLIEQSKYSNKADLQETWEEVKGNLYHINKEFQSLNKYVINLYCNNKVVALRHPSIEPIDSRLRGKSALWFKHIVGNRIKGFFPGIYIYIPKGGSLEDLQRIP